MSKHLTYAGSTSAFDCIHSTVPAAVLTGMTAEKQQHSSQKCVNGNKTIQRKYLSHIYSITQQSTIYIYIYIHTHTGSAKKNCIHTLTKENSMLYNRLL